MSTTLLEPTTQVQGNPSILDYLSTIRYFNICFNDSHPHVFKDDRNQGSFNLEEVLQALGFNSEQQLWRHRSANQSGRGRSFTLVEDKLTVEIAGMLFLTETITSEPLFTIKTFTSVNLKE